MRDGELLSWKRKGKDAPKHKYHRKLPRGVVLCWCGGLGGGGRDGGGGGGGGGGGKVVPQDRLFLNGNEKKR